VRDALEEDAFEGVVGGHAEVEDLFGGDAADGHLDIGGHAWRSLEFVIDDDADFVVVADGVSFAEVDDWSAGHGSGGVDSRQRKRRQALRSI
jgi:hypothetical protein